MIYFKNIVIYEVTIKHLINLGSYKHYKDLLINTYDIKEKEMTNLENKVVNSHYTQENRIIALLDANIQFVDIMRILGVSRKTVKKVFENKSAYYPDVNYTEEEIKLINKILILLSAQYDALSLVGGYRRGLILRN